MVILLRKGFVLESPRDSFPLFLAFLPDHIRHIGFHWLHSPLLKHELVVPPSVVGSAGSLSERFLCSRLKTEGTKTSVATVANSRPPITARPSGAFCSPPSPRPSAMGIMPMIMARAVIRTGRKRV